MRCKLQKCSSIVRPPVDILNGICFFSILHPYQHNIGFMILKYVDGSLTHSPSDSSLALFYTYHHIMYNVTPYNETNGNTCESN